MNHFTVPSFWVEYEKLPKFIQKLADKNFKILKENLTHPSLHLKKTKKFWSVRIGIKHRALAIEIDNGLLWFWIGTHASYDKLVK